MTTLRISFAAAVMATLAACGTNTSDNADTTQETPPTVAEAPANSKSQDAKDPGVVASLESTDIDPAFDLLATSVVVDGDEIVFRSDVVGTPGSETPEPVGDLNQAPVWSYVWPTSLDSSTVGFESDQGILALAATSHPDFDDTPLYDEDGDGDKANDGADWHAHWVVLVESPECGGLLSVRDIPEGESPELPPTWPELPILIDSPDIPTTITDQSVEIRVPASDIGSTNDFNFDGVTSGLRVSTSPHDPLLCVDAVFDVASGDLSLPGKVD